MSSETLWMLPDTTPYSILKTLPDPQETHPQQARGELVDFTDEFWVAQG